MKDYYKIFSESGNAGKKSALCILTETKGSSPRKAGTKMIVYADGTMEGTIGGGSFEMEVLKDAMDVIRQGVPQKFSYNLEENLDMHCGGKAEVYIEPSKALDYLYIFGAGHVGKALGKYAADFGFNVTFIDARETAIQEVAASGTGYIAGDYIDMAREIDFPENSYIVIVTPKHEFDEKVLAICAKKNSAYLGMIGSKTKVELARKRLLESGALTEKEIDRVDMPIGIKFNAHTPEEISISILARMIDVRNSRQK
ncbi:MAG: XdhC family protein [Bacteroidales bacterium]|nr:XdhC family protein [Bacteroidales bacterium]